MKYEMNIEKVAGYAIVDKKKQPVWSARYTDEQFATLGASVAASLGPKFGSFEVIDLQGAHRLSIEYQDQPTIEATTEVNDQIDTLIAAWQGGA